MNKENKNLEIVILKNVIKYIECLEGDVIANFVNKYWNSDSMFCGELSQYNTTSLELWANNPTQILSSIKKYLDDVGCLYYDFTNYESIINNVAIDYINRLLSKYDDCNEKVGNEYEQIKNDLFVLLDEKIDNFNKTV